MNNILARGLVSLDALACDTGSRSETDLMTLMTPRDSLEVATWDAIGRSGGRGALRIGSCRGSLQLAR
jgi:hypothetical protein